MARTYEDFEPSCDWKREDGSDSLTINLPEFKKEQLRIQLDSYGQMKISGERKIDGNKWSRFRKDVHVPENCIQTEIRARFENGTLHVTMPKSTRHQSKPGSHKSSRFSFGLKWPSKMVVGVVVASVIVVALAIYAAYNVRFQERNGD